MKNVYSLVAYVSGEREGIILETPYEIGESLNDTAGLNIETEQKLVEKTIDELKTNGSTEETITLTMKHLGLERYWKLDGQVLINLIIFFNSDMKKTIILLNFLFIIRAMMYGWPNTYVFTKAMGEMVVGDLRDNVPLVIIRPTVITSTYKQPFPGWVEDMKYVI